MSGLQPPPAVPRIYGFVGVAAGGQCDCAGVKVGDKITSVVDITVDAAPVNVTSAFGSVVTVADKIPQSSTDNYSAKGLLACVTSVQG